MFLFLLGKNLGVELLVPGGWMFAFRRNCQFSKMMNNFILTPAM